MSGPTREQVLQMAREAGFPVMGPARADAAERFAALAYAAGQAAEREACAKVCDPHAQMSTSEEGGDWAASCAAAIRARGQQ